MLGDFNEVMHPNEVLGGNFHLFRSILLSNMAFVSGLIDFETKGGHVTCRKNIQNGVHIRKKLDRCLANPKWLLLFPHSMEKLLVSNNSDHNPILVHCLKSPSQRKEAFHFQAAWMNHPDYPPLIDHVWRGTPGDAICKLDEVRDQSILFNKTTFGNIFRKKQQLEARIRGIHRQLDHTVTSDLTRQERMLQDEYQ